MEGEMARGHRSFKYIGVTLAYKAKSVEEILNDNNGQGKRAIRQLVLAL